jgi:hypothetical protein
MRVTSALFVAALVRRAFGAGAAAVVAHHGAEEAGAIFVLVDRLDGSGDFYGPAPQSLAAEDGAGDRLFQRLAEGEPMAALEERVGRERRFDPDLWLVAIEDRDGRAFLDLAPG